MKIEYDWREEYLQQLRRRAKEARRRIVVAEKNDARVMEAVCEAVKEEIADITIVGDKKAISKTIRELGFEQDLVEIIDPRTDNRVEYLSEMYVKGAQNKGKSVLLDEAILTMKNPTFYGAMLLKTGFADGLVCGATSPSSEVLRATLKAGLNSGDKVVSGSMIMLMPSQKWGYNGVFVFADIVVIPDPSSEQMVEITRDTLYTASEIAGIDPKVAMISFSTKGSAKHQKISKVIDAVALFKKKYPEFIIDGELQLDSAICPEIGRRKAPDSLVAGRANVLIFPDLNTGNVAVKMAEHLGGAIILGSIIQGLEKPVNDLSRGSNKEDIKNTIAVTALGIKA